MRKCSSLEYDIVLSFAGEDRIYVEKTARFLRKTGVRVFYDRYEATKLWGKDLYQHLDRIYQNMANYAVIFISEHYGKKLWTNHELKSAQARAFSENEEYILPARFDDTEIPGIRKTIGYIDLKYLTPIQFGKIIIQKLKEREIIDFIPKNLSFMRQALREIFDDFDDEIIDNLVLYVFNLLKTTNELEKQFLASFILQSCPHDITEDLHQDITLIQRMSGFDRNEIIEILKSLRNIGFEYKITKTIHGCTADGNEQEYELLSIKLIPMNPNLELDNLTIILFLMYFGVNCQYCDVHSKKALLKLNFSALEHKIEVDEMETILSYIPAIED